MSSPTAAKGRSSSELAEGSSPPLPPSHEAVRVLLVDDHAIWRGGVRAMLEHTEFEVVGEAGSGAEALREAGRLHPDLVLLDIRMAGGDGLDALMDIKRAVPRTAVIMLTTYENPTFLSRAVAGGAAGYLLKGIRREELLTSLRTVANGGMLLDRRHLGYSLRGITGEEVSADDLTEPLTGREVEVLRLLATGRNNHEIGAILFVADCTVKTHVERIIRKLGVSDRVQAAVWAARHGLASVEATETRDSF